MSCTVPNCIACSDERRPSEATLPPFALAGKLPWPLRPGDRLADGDGDRLDGSDRNWGGRGR